MQRLFDHDVATPARPKADPAQKRRELDLAELGSGAPQAIWALLLDRGADPLALAALLRDGVPASERRRAYLEMVRDLGPALAARVWTEAFVARGLKRAALPSDARDVAEAALGESLDGVQLVSGPAVEALTARLGTPAFTVGQEVFAGAGGGEPSVLVHEAIHAAQQRGAAAVGRPGAPSDAAERDVHRVLRRIGPLGRGDRFARERARTAMAVRAALGRAPRVTTRPLQLAAYEATHGIVDAVQGEAKKLVEALVKLLDGNADRTQLTSVLGAAADSFAQRIRATALHELAGRTTAAGKDARLALAQKLGGVDPLSGERGGKPLPSAVRAELESRLGVPLGGVRVHDDDAAAAEARRLGALAFTQGQDVFFADGKLDPSSTEGKRLLAHEVAHVAQQAGAPAAASPSLSAPGSAVEREADRVADAVVAGPQPGQGPIAVQERAAAGTISRKDASAGGGGSKFAVNLYTYKLDTDTGTGVDTSDGMKKLTLSQSKFGPVSLDELKVQVDGDKVARGTLKAHLDDGKFKGAATTLNVDSQGNVSGQLDLGLKAPGAFAKNVKVTVTNDGLSAKANISAADFVGKDFPVKAAGDMAVQVQNSAAGLDVSMVGASTVELDAGFAGGQGTMTAVILPGTINTTIAAKFSVPGLGSEIEASIKWDGKTIDIAATAALQVTIPGLAGTAKVSYKGGKLDVDIPDLKFVADALAALKFAKQHVEDGKLKGKVTVAGSVAFESAGAHVTLNGSSTLAIDGAQIAGKAAGTFGIGPKGATLVEGAFDVGMADGGFDGSVTLSKANVSFLQANNVTATVKGIGKDKPTVKVTGDIAVNLGDTVKGSIKGLSYDGGAPTGDVSIDFKIPQVTVPQLNFTLGSGWSLKSAAKELKASIDFADGVLGNLGGLDLDLSLQGGGTLPKLSSVLGDLVVKAKSVSVPGFEGLGTLDDFNLKIPGTGGKYEFGQASGNAKLTINLGSKPTKVAIAVHEGKVSAKVKSEVDIHELAPALSGKIRIGVDTAAAEKLSIEASEVHAADPELAKQLVVSKAAYKNGKLTATASVSGQLSYGGMTLNVAESHLVVDTSSSPGLTGSAKFSVAGEGAKADITATVNKEGKLDIAGESDIDLGQVTGGAMTGKVHAAGGSAGGLKKFTATGAKVTKKPFDAVTIKSIGYDKGSDHLDVDLELKADALSMPGLKLDKLDGAVHFVKNGGAVGFDGHLKSAGIAFEAGETAVGNGSLDLTYKAGVVTGNAELKTLALKFGSFAATVSNFKLDLADGTPKAAAGSEPAINVKQEGLFDVTMKAKFGGNGIEQFAVNGTITQTPITKQTAGQATWTPGKGATFKVEGQLDDLGGLIDGDKSFHVGYDGQKLDAGIEKFTVQKGDLKGWSLSGSVSGKDLDVAIESPDAGQAWSFGNIEIALAGKQTLKYTTATGAAGEVKGKVGIGEASVAVGATFANSKITSISAEANNLEIHEIIPPLAGKFSISYDSAKKDLKSKGSVGPSDPELAKALHVDYTYEDKVFTGTFTAQPNAPFAVGPLSGRVTECSIKCVLGAGKTAFSGSVSADTASEAGPPSIGKVSYNPDGKGLKFEGSFEVDAAGLTGGYVTGRFKVDKGAGGTGLWAKDLNFAKGPLAGKVEAFAGGFDTAKRSFAIDVTITPAALKQVLPSWITAKSALKVAVAKAGDKAPFKVDVQGDATFAIEFGEYFSGSISIKKVQDAIAADLTMDKAKFDAGDFKFSGAGKLSYDSTSSPKIKVDPNSKLDVSNDALGVKGSLTALADSDGNVNGAHLEGKLAETGLTTEASFQGSYQTGKKYDLSGEATFKSVDGLLDPGAKLALGYDTEQGFHATADNIKLAAGALKGLTIVKAWFTSKGANKGWGVNIKGGVDLDLSDDVKAHVDDSSDFTAKGTGSGAPSFSGVVKGTVKVGDLANIKLKFTGAGEDIKIHADNQEGTEIGKLTEDIVTGQAKFQYDGSMKSLKGGTFKFQLDSPTVNVGKIQGEAEDGAPKPTVPPQLGSVIESIKGQHDTEGWTGSVTVRDTALEVMGAKIHVHQSKVSYKKDKKLDGAIKADAGGGGAEAKVEIGWKTGKFYFKGGLDFEISELTEFAAGRVHADVDSGSGDGNLTNLTPITTKGVLAGISITKLRGSRKKKLFKFNAKLKEFLQHAAGGVLPESIHLTVGEDSAIDVEKKGQSLAAVGKISAGVEFRPGGQKVASGQLDLGFDGSGVSAKASNVEFELKDYLKGKNISVDFATGLESGSTLTFDVPGVAKGDINDLVIKPKSSEYGFDSKINFDPSLHGLHAVQLGVKLDKGVLSAKADSDQGGQLRGRQQQADHRRRLDGRARHGVEEVQGGLEGRRGAAVAARQGHLARRLRRQGARRHRALRRGAGGHLRGDLGRRRLQERQAAHDQAGRAQHRRQVRPVLRQDAEHHARVRQRPQGLGQHRRAAQGARRHRRLVRARQRQLRHPLEEAARRRHVQHGQAQGDVEVEAQPEHRRHRLQHQGRRRRRRHRWRRIHAEQVVARVDQGDALQDLGRLRRLGEEAGRLRHQGVGGRQGGGGRRQRRHGGGQAGVHRHRQADSHRCAEVPAGGRAHHRPERSPVRRHGRKGQVGLRRAGPRLPHHRRARGRRDRRRLQRFVHPSRRPVGARRPHQVQDQELLARRLRRHREDPVQGRAAARGRRLPGRRARRHHHRQAGDRLRAQLRHQAEGDAQGRLGLRQVRAGRHPRDRLRRPRAHQSRRHHQPQAARLSEVAQEPADQGDLPGRRDLGRGQLRLLQSVRRRSARRHHRDQVVDLGRLLRRGPPAGDAARHEAGGDLRQDRRLGRDRARRQLLPRRRRRRVPRRSAHRSLVQGRRVQGRGLDHLDPRQGVQAQDWRRLQLHDRTVLDPRPRPAREAEGGQLDPSDRGHQRGPRDPAGLGRRRRARSRHRLRRGARLQEAEVRVRQARAGRRARRAQERQDAGRQVRRQDRPRRRRRVLHQHRHLGQDPAAHRERQDGRQGRAQGDARAQPRRRHSRPVRAGQGRRHLDRSVGVGGAQAARRAARVPEGQGLLLHHRRQGLGARRRRPGGDPARHLQAVRAHRLQHRRAGRGLQERQPEVQQRQRQDHGRRQVGLPEDRGRRRRRGFEAEDPHRPGTDPGGGGAVGSAAAELEGRDDHRAGGLRQLLPRRAR